MEAEAETALTEATKAVVEDEAAPAPEIPEAPAPAAEEEAVTTEAAPAVEEMAKETEVLEAAAAAVEAVTTGDAEPTIEEEAEEETEAPAGPGPAEEVGATDDAEPAVEEEAEETGTAAATPAEVTATEAAPAVEDKTEETEIAAVSAEEAGTREAVTEPEEKTAETETPAASGPEEEAVTTEAAPQAMEKTEEMEKIFIMEKYIPHKTPYVVFDNFKKIIDNNSFCEIGCGWGHNLNYIKNNFNVSKIGGIELRIEQVEYCKEKYNFDEVICDDIFNIKTIPKYDVYYVWSSFSYEQYLKLVSKIDKGVILISFHISSPICDNTECKGCGINFYQKRILEKLSKYYTSSKIIQTNYKKEDEYSIHKCRTSGILKTLMMTK